VCNFVLKDFKKNNFLQLCFFPPQERCTRTIITAYVGSILLCIPSFVTFGIEQQEVAVEQQSAWWTKNTSSSVRSVPPPTTFIYKVNLNPIAQNYDGIVHKVKGKQLQSRIYSI